MSKTVEKSDGDEGFSVQERAVAQFGQGDREVDMKARSRTMDGPAPNGFGHSVAIRPGLDLNVYDIASPIPTRTSATTTAGFSIVVMLEAKGHGQIGTGRQDARNGFEYASETVYFSHVRSPTVGVIELPAGARFRFVDLRLSPRFAEAIGIAAQLDGLSRTHAFHLLSGSTVWLGSAPAPAAMLAEAQAIFKATFGRQSSDLMLESNTLRLLDESNMLLFGANSPAALAKDAVRLKTIRDLVLSDIATQWTIKDLARRAAMSATRFKSSFREQFGVPIYQFLQAARLDQARTLLIASDMRVTDIALAVGYTNPSHFTALFRKKFGSAPTDFRRVNTAE